MSRPSGPRFVTTHGNTLRAVVRIVDCHRRCCVCHRFCGVKIEVDHMHPKAEGGSDDVANAIPLCFECHAEVHLYNAKHPKGSRFTVAGLQKHRENWLRIFSERPEVLLDPPRSPNPGSLERLLHELEFNE